MAGALGVDAHPHSLERDEHRATAEPSCFHDHCRNLPADCGQAWLCRDVFGFAACTVVYFITAAVFLPETKGKTLEEIEAHFEGARKSPTPA